MQTKQAWLALAIGSVSALAVTAATAAGLGSGSSSAVLGQPLDFAVQVRLDPGETIGPECVSAEVTSGDRRVPPSQVTALVEMTGPDTARVRVITQPAIDEPVVGIQLAVGCSARITRRYVVLADPPVLTAAAQAPAFAVNPAPVQEGQAAVALPAAAVGSSVRTAGSAAGPDAGTAATVLRPSTGLSSSRAAAARTQDTASAQLTQAPIDPAEAERRAQRRAERRAAARAARAERLARQERAVAARAAAAATTQTGALGAGGTPARLRLDFVDTPAQTAQAGTATAVEEALAAVAQAASAARAAASSASASAERISVLERTVEQLREEAKSSRDLAAQFKQRLTDAEGSSFLVLPLMVMAALLAALAAWLAWRLGRVQSERQQVWREAVAPPRVPDPVTEATPSRQPTAPIPFVTSELRPASSAAAAVRGRSSPAWPPPAPPVAWPPPDSTLAPDDTRPPDLATEREGDRERAPEPETLTQRTLPLMRPGSDEGAPRDVSIEELIDLEQQAEFFVVLGQDDAAIDLLVEHLRSTGGGSPLPYLKLLEIHHRRDDREAYDRMRTRFNHRFNAYAPEWGVDLGHGRSLDDYSGVIPRLQQVWPRPLDAMAELEALLFRKSRGELFDLPAYREVLFLYSLARDLLDRGAADTGNVDLLLPMADGGDFSSTAPSPFQRLERDAFRDTQVPDDRPTAPVDFDVSAIDRPTSIFDLLDDKPPTPPRH